MTFFDDLKKLVLIPSPSRNEFLMTQFLKERIAGLVDSVEVDLIGNLYAHRKGNKQGHLMFSAHQDKVLYGNKIGLVLKDSVPEFNTNLTFRYLTDFPTYPGQAFVQSAGEFYPINFPQGVSKKDLILLSKEEQPQPPQAKGHWEEVVTQNTTTTNDATIQAEIEAMHKEIDNLIAEFQKEENSKSRKAIAQRGIELRKEIEKKSRENPTKKSSYKRWVPAITTYRAPLTRYGFPGHLVDTEGFEFGRYGDLDVFHLGNFQAGEKPNSYLGKFDDALGLALIIDLLENTQRENTPDITALLTVQEEIGHKGAEHAIDKKFVAKYNPDGIIVFDTTAKLKLGQGLALYERCDSPAYTTTYNGTIDDEFVVDPIQVVGTTVSGACSKFRKSKAHDLEIDLKNFAKQHNYRLTGMPAGSNDSRTFAADTNIPTVAIEVPISDMHSDIETADITDIHEARRFVKAYLTR